MIASLGPKVSKYDLLWAIWLFPKIKGPFFGSPCSKSPTILDPQIKGFPRSSFKGLLPDKGQCRAVQGFQRGSRAERTYGKQGRFGGAVNVVHT